RWDDQGLPIADGKANTVVPISAGYCWRIPLRGRSAGGWRSWAIQGPSIPRTSRGPVEFANSIRTFFETVPRWGQPDPGPPAGGSPPSLARRTPQRLPEGRPFVTVHL